MKENNKLRYSYIGGKSELDLNTATYDELIEALDRISDFKALIQGKIDFSVDACQTGNRTRWRNLVRRHDSQLRKLNQALAAMAERKRDERQDERAKEGAEFGRCFIDCAKLVLSARAYDDIVLAATAMQEQRKVELCVSDDDR